MDEAKHNVKARFARDPLPLIGALGLRVDERRSKPPKLVWCFDGPEENASLQIGGRTGAEGLCTRYGDDWTGDCFALVQRVRRGDFRAALEFAADVYGVPLEARGRLARASRKNAPKPEATRRTVYEVRDEAGGLVAEHVRFDNADGTKTFKWRRNGTWGLKGLKECSLPVYRLPELLSEPAGGMVLVTEGEKACEAARAAGWTPAVATYGASVLPCDDALRPLVSYAPILWPDNDAPGRAHMDAVGRRLVALGAEPRLLEWTDAPVKGDAADFLAAHSPEDLAALVVGAAPFVTGDHAEAVENGERPAAREDMIWTPADVLATKVAEVAWLWPYWLPLGFITILAAAPGDGKSGIALDLARRLILGLEWPSHAELDNPPRVARPPCAPVLVLDCEGCQGIWVNRIRDWRVPPEEVLFPGDGFQRVALDDPEALAGIHGTVAKLGVKLVVIDSLRAGLPAGVDENDSAIQSILAPWADLARDCECAVLVIHHFGKPRKGEGKEASLDRLRGSTAIGALGRAILAVDRPQSAPRDEDARMRLSCVKNNLGPFPSPIGFAIGADGVEWCDAPEPDQDKRAPARAGAKEFLQARLQTGAVLLKELRQEAEGASISSSALYGAKKQLGLVEIADPEDPAHRQKLWGLPDRRHRDTSGW